MPTDGNGSAKVERRLAAILAADIAGYSALMGADEEATVRDLKAHQSVILPIVRENSGRVIDTAGDGILAEFASVLNAVKCAVAVQKTMAERNTVVDPARRMKFRIGINQGDIVFDDARVYGDGINVAARLESIAEPGGICISDKVHQEIRGKIDLKFQDLGSQQLKNISEPVRVYRIEQMQLPSDKPPLALPDKPSIAVLPFTNMSGDREQDYFADGVVEDIITALSRFKELSVIARNSSFVYKGRAVDIQQVARELGVRYALEGSVRKAGNRVRITGQLIDAATRTHLWADRFDGAIEDVFELQDRITESVVGALLPTLRQAEIERARRKPPASLDAYDYLLRALPLVIANTVAEADTAIELLEEALLLAPDYAYAHALIATACGVIVRSAVGAERVDARAKGVAHARRAVALGGDDSAVLATAGFMLLILNQDVFGARTALDRAVALNANSATAFTHRALVLAIAGEPELAIEDAKRALRLNPLDPTGFLPQMAIVVAQIELRQYEEAVTSARKVMEINPRYPMSYAWTMVAECARGNAVEAERQMRRLAEMLPGFTPPTLAKLFDVFPDPLRSNSISVLRDAGLLPADEA